MSNIAHMRCFYSHFVETAVVMFTFCVVCCAGLAERETSSIQGETASEVRLSVYLTKMEMDKYITEALIGCFYTE